MKTKVLIMLCLLLGIGLTQLSAQPDNKNGTGAVVTWHGTDLAYNYRVPVFCNGEWIDLLLFNCTVHRVDHFKNGDWLSLVVVIHGEAASTNGSGEVFNLNYS